MKGKLSFSGLDANEVVELMFLNELKDYYFAATILVEKTRLGKNFWTRKPLIIWNIALIQF